MYKVTKIICCLILGIVVLQSCKSYKNITYFGDVPDSSKLIIKIPKPSPLQIQEGDILSISVFTLDANANAIFSQGPGSSSPQSGSSLNTSSLSASNNLNSNVPVFTVDEKGNLELPLVGIIHAKSLTTDSIKNIIETKMEQFYKDPTVIVKLVNLKVSILGEVMRPGSYNLVNEKNTILDAIALAGDLSIYGKRENILHIRDSSGVTIFNRFSLNSKNIMKLPYFYLKQNDVIYVEPAKEKIATMDADLTRKITITTTITTSIITLLIILATRVK